MKTPATTFLLLMLFGSAASAHAQGIEWQTLNDEVTSLFQQGQYDRAVVVAKKALDAGALPRNGPDRCSRRTGEAGGTYSSHQAMKHG